ncbi:LysE family translocator [Chromohalobacter canadensis]|uniref:LysE family translocator n=1 Tax=Chromohalobacter canadensis TaxID=141389 RepID=UPI0021BEF4E0|nr:LysE family translocator [Chromohalobacter canadensis]MCT8469026.1 LysE family translocator [Chromohalobacter canadensis]MCT8472784.1 LysE family translocator [Chromohalobacter canadensis]MCT8500236.1 LysE family translocator [Chromohalobacter canadensis]
MFDYTLVHWLAFLSAAVLLNLSPGPDIAFMLGQTLRSGRRYGFAAMLGGWSGTALHVAMAAAGLSAILATSALAFSVIKWVGAAYLIWLGVKMLLSKGDSFVSNSGRHDVKAQSVYWQGVLVSVLNPKVAIFFLAFLPQFVVQGAGPVGAQLFLHGSLIIVVAAFIEPLLVMVGAKLGAFLKASPRVGMWMDRGLGSLFVALGARLAVSTR